MSAVRIRTVDFDRLASSAPLNKQAAVDYAARGELPSAITAGGHILDGPPRMRPPPAGITADLTGRRFGALTVLGLKAFEPWDGKWVPVRWVCRCDCGNYTMRQHKKLLAKPADADERCPECEQKRRVLSNGGSKRAEKRLRHAIRMARERPG